MKDYVFEIRHEEWDDFPGNELYETIEQARVLGEQDYRDSFPGDGILKWEPILRSFHVLYEDDIPTDVTLRIRHVNSLATK